jgi:hypothetical protein
MLAESLSHNVPLRPDLASEYSQYAVPDPLKVDFAAAAAARNAAINQMMKAIRNQEEDELAQETEPEQESEQTQDTESDDAR